MDERRAVGERKVLSFRGSFWALANVIAVVTSLSTVAGFVGSWHWFLDLFTHFRVQYLVSLTAVAVLFAFRRRWKEVIVYSALALLNFSTVLPLYWSDDPSPPGVNSEQSPALRVLLANVNRNWGEPELVAKMLGEFDADLVVLVEIDADWLAQLAPALGEYAHSVTRPRSDNFGIALFSKLPLEGRVVNVGNSRVPSIVATVRATAGSFTMIATHPLPPYNRSSSLLRNQQLEALAELARQADTPVILLGDLNTSPWSSHFHDLLQRSGLKNSLRGWGLQSTWPTHLVLFRIPLDHCLHSPEMSTVARSIGPHIGSDHFPLIVDLVFDGAH